MSSFEEKVKNFVGSFEQCTRQQQNDVLQQLLLKCQPLQLRVLYSHLKPLLAVDFISYLPKELSERIFCYLSAVDLCRIAQCCKLWRDRTNHNPTWHRLCILKKWDSFGEKQDLISNTATVKIFQSCDGKLKKQLSFDFDPDAQSVLKPPLCRWKDVYIRAFHLELNWAVGRYTVAPLLRGHKEPVTSISFSGNTLVSGSLDNTVRVWDLPTGNCRHILEGHTDNVQCVQLKDNICVTGCNDSIVRIYDVRTGKCLWSLHGHSSGVDHLCFDGKYAVSASSDRKLCVWDVKAGKKKHVLTGHDDEIQSLVLYKHFVVSSSWDNSVRVWDMKKGHVILIFRDSGVVFCCKMDDDQVVVGLDSGEIKVWSMHTGDCSLTLTGHTDEVYCLDYNSEVIVSGSADSTARIWSWKGVLLHTLVEHIGIVRCLHLSSSRLVTGGDRKKVVVWDWKKGKLLNVVHRNPTLLHRMLVSDTHIITASPEKPGTITIISYW